MFTTGQKVIWRHIPRGGYGYVFPTPAVVVRVGPKRVTIEVGLKVGGTKLVRVDPESLRTVGAK